MCVYYGRYRVKKEAYLLPSMPTYVAFSSKNSKCCKGYEGLTIGVLPAYAYPGIQARQPFDELRTKGVSPHGVAFTPEFSREYGGQAYLEEHEAI